MKQLINDLTATIAYPERAAGSFTLSGPSANGGGVVSLIVAGVTYSTSTTAAESANAILTRIAAQFDANTPLIDPVVGSGSLVYSARDAGSNGNSIIVTGSSTDSNLTASIIAMSGGIGPEHAVPMVTITSTAMLFSMTINADTIINNGHELQRILKSEFNWELTGFIGNKSQKTKAIVSHIFNEIYPLGTEPQHRQYAPM